MSVNAATGVAAASRQHRAVGSFQSAAAARKYWILLGVLAVVGAISGFGLLAYENPMELGTRKWWLIAQRRADAVTAMAIVAVCQAVATVAFHTVTNNRILTPSIMGFESLYVAINTATIFFLGSSGLTQAPFLKMTNRNTEPPTSSIMMETTPSA